MATIAGNVGGSAGSGALIQLKDTRNTILKKAVADGSGNFTFTVANNNTYQIQASLAGFRIPEKYEIPVQISNVADVNFTIKALNAANQV